LHLEIESLQLGLCFVKRFPLRVQLSRIKSYDFHDYVSWLQRQERRLSRYP